MVLPRLQAQIGMFLEAMASEKPVDKSRWLFWEKNEQDDQSDEEEAAADAAAVLSIAKG